MIKERWGRREEERGREERKIVVGRGEKGEGEERGGAGGRMEHSHFSPCSFFCNLILKSRFFKKNYLLLFI